SIHEILQFLAGLEKGNFLWRDVYLGAGLGIAPHAAATVARTKAAKAANLDLVALLQGLNNVIENGLHDGLGVRAFELGNALDFRNQVGLRQSRLLGHRPSASSWCRSPNP